MIAASVPDSEDVLNLLLKAGADVNEKSEFICSSCHVSPINMSICR